MHILEAYSTSCGLKIDKPFILDKFHGLTVEKYITIHTGDGKFDSRTYDYWQDVIDFLGNFLKPYGISIVQVGSKKDPKLTNVINCNGKTSINQLAYVIKNSLLHVGIDSLPIHIASAYGRKIVCLYSNAPSQNSKPYWSKDEDLILIESDKGGDKPTYAKTEIPKTINSIMPDTIFLSVLKLLGLDSKYNYEMIYIGKEYPRSLIEYIPNFEFEFEKISPLYIRMDLHFDETFSANALKNNKASIVTNRPLSTPFLKANKENISKIVIRANEYDKVADLANFALKLKDNCIDFFVFSSLKGDELNDVKFEFLDISLVKNETITKKENIKQLNGVDINSLFYLPNKFVLSEGKIYDNLCSVKKGDNIEKLQKRLTKVKYDEDDFWDEAQHFCFLKKSLTKKQA